MYQLPTLIDGVPQGWRVLHAEDPFNGITGPFFNAVDVGLEEGDRRASACLSAARTAT